MTKDEKLQEQWLEQAKAEARKNLQGEEEDAAETEDSAEEQEKLKHELLGQIGGNEDMTTLRRKE